MRARAARVIGAARWQVATVARGHRARRVRATRWHVGFRWGALARTRVTAVFKRRISTKKQRKREQLSAPARQQRERQLERIRQTRAGLRRRAVGGYDRGAERQLRGLQPT
jgi:hypothetical protein